MPTREDADDDDARDAADSGDRGGANSVSRPRVSTAIHHVLQTIVQHAAEAFHDKLKPLSSVLCTLELSGVNWNSNPGVIVAALLRTAGNPRLGQALTRSVKKRGVGSQGRAEGASGGRAGRVQVAPLLIPSGTRANRRCARAMMPRTHLPVAPSFSYPCGGSVGLWQAHRPRRNTRGTSGG